MTTTTFTVAGMTCDHCVQSVKSEISKLPGVIEVDVDLGSGNVGVTSEGDVDSSSVRAAVAEAGYDLAS